MQMGIARGGTMFHRPIASLLCVLSVLAFAGRGRAADLPKGLTIGVAGQPLTANQNYVDQWYLRRGLAETDLPPDQKEKAQALFAAAEKDAQSLAVQAADHPEDVAKFDESARASREKFDKDAGQLLTAAQVADITDHVGALFMEELLVFNGGSVLADEAIPGAGITLAPEQIQKMKQATSADADKLSKLMQAMMNNPGATRKPVTDLDKDETSSCVVRIRQNTLNALTAEQQKKFYKAVLDQIHQAAGPVAPATSPGPQ
jgi:hypothetical protein